MLFEATLSDGRTIRVRTDDPAKVAPHVAHHALTTLVLAIKRGFPATAPATFVSMQEILES